MNKSMLMGVALGVGVATASGVAGYQFLGNRAQVDQGSAIVEPEPATFEDRDATSATTPVHATSATTPVRAAAAPERSAPPPAPRPAAQIAQPAPAATASTLPDCNPDATQPKDGKRIAGTAIGALVGGAVARDVGDRNLTTAVGAAVGAYAGNKIQQKIQERKASEAGTPCSR